MSRNFGVSHTASDAASTAQPRASTTDTTDAILEGCLETADAILGEGSVVASHAVSDDASTNRPGPNFFLGAGPFPRATPRAPPIGGIDPAGPVELDCPPYGLGAVNANASQTQYSDQFVPRQATTHVRCV